MIDVRTLRLDHEMLVEAAEELLVREAVQVLHHAVVIDNRQLVGRETDRHEVIIFLVAPVVGILLCLFSPHKGGGGGTMVAVGDIERRNLGKQLRDAVDIRLIVDNPEGMAKAVVGSHEIILRRASGIFRHELVQLGIVGIGKEDRLDIRVIDADVLHAVLLFVATRELVLFDDPVHIVRDIGPDDETVLRLAVHRLGINVIALLLVLDQPTTLLEETEVVGGLLIDTRIVLVGADGEIDFGFDNMIQRFFIALGLATRFIGIKHIVRAGNHLSNQVFGRTEAAERFNGSHFQKGIICFSFPTTRLARGYK